MCDLPIPDDMCDAHKAVVNGDTEVVYRETAAPQQDKVPERVSVPCNITSDGILDCDILGLE